MSRSDRSDLEWAFIKCVLPNKSRGVKRVDDRRVINGIFYALRVGCPWRDLPDQYGPYTTVPAVVATRFNPDMRAKYEQLTSAGKCKKLAITAVMRKLIVMANALLRDGRKWTETRASPALEFFETPPNPDYTPARAIRLTAVA